MGTERLQTFLRLWPNFVRGWPQRLAGFRNICISFFVIELYLFLFIISFISSLIPTDVFLKTLFKGKHFAVRRMREG